jgi:hypothetical protein
VDSLQQQRNKEEKSKKNQIDHRGYFIDKRVGKADESNLSFPKPYFIPIFG